MHLLLHVSRLRLLLLTQRLRRGPAVLLALAPHVGLLVARAPGLDGDLRTRRRQSDASGERRSAAGSVAGRDGRAGPFWAAGGGAGTRAGAGRSARRLRDIARAKRKPEAAHHSENAAGATRRGAGARGQRGELSPARSAEPGRFRP